MQNIDLQKSDMQKDEKQNIEIQQKLKEKYNATEVPEEAGKRIRLGIAQAQSEKKKQKKIVYLRRAGLGVAAACLCIVVMANGSYGTAYALQKIPVIGEFAKIVTFRDYKDRTKHFEASVDVPQISDTSGKSKELEKTNQSIQQYADTFIKMYENDLKESEGIGNYELKSSYRVLRENKEEFVLEIDTILVMASGTEYKKIFNVDKRTGKIKKISDYFQKDSDYLSVLTKEIKRQMRQQMKEDSEKIYFIDSDSEEAQEDFQKLSEDVDFYFDDNGDLVVVFDECEVAPGYMKDVSFTIKRQVFENLLAVQ